MVGRSGSGKSSLINNVIGEDCLPIHELSPKTTTTTAQHVHRELLINDNKYQCTFIELHIPDELLPSYSSTMIQMGSWIASPIYSLLEDHIAKNPYLRECVEGLNLFIYVMGMGRLTVDDINILQAYMNIFPQSISALVVTRCDSMNYERRTRVVEDYKSYVLTKYYNAGSMGKGIYTVGFPDLTELDDEDVTFLMSRLQKDVSQLHQLIKESSDSVDVLNGK